MFISEYTASIRSDENVKRKKAARRAKHSRYLERKLRIRVGNRKASEMQKGA